MICSNCQKENRKGSRFCQFCGTPLTEEKPVVAPAAETEPVAEEVIAEVPVTEEVIAEAPAAEEMIAEVPAEDTPAAEPVPVVAPVKAEKPKKEKKPKGKRPVGQIILSVLLIVLLLASAGLNVYQYAQYTQLKQNSEKASAEMTKRLSNLTKEKAELEQTLDDANETIDGLWETIDEMSAEMNKEAEQLDAYYRLFDCLVYSNLGYFSEEFYTDYAIISLAVGEEDSVILTTAWEGSGTVDLQTDNDCAEVDFAEDSWSTQVQINVVANEAGVTVATFTWEEQEASFDVIILVYEE